MAMAVKTQYVVKMDFENVNDRSTDMLNVFLNNPKIQKYILNKTETSAIVTLPIFEYLQFDIEYERSIRKNIVLELVKHDIADNFQEVILDDIKVGTEKYDVLLQEIRF